MRLFVCSSFRCSFFGCRFLLDLFSSLCRLGAPLMFSGFLSGCDGILVGVTTCWGLPLSFWSFPPSSFFASAPSLSRFGVIMHRPTFFLPFYSGPTPLFPPLHCPFLSYLGVLVALTSFTSCFPCTFLFIPCPFCRCPF